jgi:hypothetical protein
MVLPLVLEPLSATYPTAQALSAEVATTPDRPPAVVNVAALEGPDGLGSHRVP